MAAAYLLGGFGAVIGVRQNGTVSTSVFVGIHEVGIPEYLRKSTALKPHNSVFQSFSPVTRP